MLGLSHFYFFKFLPRSVFPPSQCSWDRLRIHHDPNPDLKHLLKVRAAYLRMWENELFADSQIMVKCVSVCLCVSTDKGERQKTITSQIKIALIIAVLPSVQCRHTVRKSPPPHLNDLIVSRSATPTTCTWTFVVCHGKEDYHWSV